MDIRDYKPEDYATIWQWWRKHKSYAPEEDLLPDSGIVVFNENYDTAAGFIYQTNSKMCIFEFVIVNPEASKKERNEALDLLIKSVVDFCNTNDYKMIYTSTSLRKYISRLKENGFIEADKEQTHMFRSL